ncbi:ROK family protein [Pedobacter helvus]|uniref:ROK family protein n=1 Tax=Pedobacter helvus TaxID=2563444 RepID=A0ABW9JD84_9SPHI|nr:ROK family protein [Pedobacter ureilyticus]
MKNQVLNISICEAAITIGRVNFINGIYVCEQSSRYPINNWASVAEVIKQWANAIISFANNSPFSALAIAAPGPFDYQNGVSYINENRNLKSLYNQNLKQLLAAELNMQEPDIVFFNDAVCALAAEPLPNEISNKKVLGLYFDEGFGSAWLSDNEFGDAQLWKQPFLTGTAEDYFSIKWLRKAYFKLTGLGFAHINDINNFSSITGKELLKEFIENLAVYLNKINNQYRFKGLLLGGAMFANNVNILPMLKKRLATQDTEISIFRSQLGGLAPLIGTAALRDMALLKT